MKRNFWEVIVDAQRKLYGAEHILCVIMPLANDQKLILKSLEKTYDSLTLSISFILKYEYIKKNIILSKNGKENEKIFFLECAKRYNIDKNEIEILKEILFLGKKHKESGFEFSRKNKVVIMDDSLQTIEINKERVIKQIKVVNKLINEVKNRFL